ncbi:MFS transporter, partial [Reichenbachiella sp.]
MEKRQLSFWEVWNLSFGFLGIQMGFALQNANASRILQIFGADVHELSWFWIVAPLMGLIVQPIVGHYSDKTWTKMGRRKPFFLTGAILAAIGLIAMPNAGALTAIFPALWIGAGMLMVMDASFNIAMEPFRALVADMMPADQRTLGFSIQTVLIGLGAVVGSWLPYALTNWFGISNEAAAGDVPLNLILSFVIGALTLVGCIMVTILTTKEYTPEELANFSDASQEDTAN